MLNSQAFLSDADIKEANRLVQKALKKHQEAIQGVKPPQSDLKIPYEKVLAEFEAIRGSALWYPYLGSGFGKGALVELLDGSVKYDFIGGIGVHFFGHSHPEIVSRSFYAALSDTVMEGNLQQNEDAFDLSKLLTQVSGFDHCFLSSSGAMANENALKIAFQNRFPAKRILAFEKAFAGRTLVLTQITDKAAYRVGLPDTIQVDHVPFYDPENPNKTLEAMEALIKRHPNDYALMMVELVQGEGGFNVGAKDFLHSVAGLLKKHNILLVIDEVQTFGRTPSLFAFQHFELQDKADIVTIGKLTQVCATLYNKSHAPKPGLISQTFTSSVSAIRAALWIIQTLISENFYGPSGRIQQIHKRFEKHLNRLAKEHPGKIQGPWGIGAMIGFTYKSGDAKETNAFAKKLFDEGLITFINGENPTRIRMLPPALVVKDEEIDEAMRILERCL